MERTCDHKGRSVLKKINTKIMDEKEKKFIALMRILSIIAFVILLGLIGKAIQLF
jgi:hypothetical protein